MKKSIAVMIIAFGSLTACVEAQETLIVEEETAEEKAVSERAFRKLKKRVLKLEKEAIVQDARIETLVGNLETAIAAIDVNRKANAAHRAEYNTLANAYAAHRDDYNDLLAEYNSTREQYAKHMSEQVNWFTMRSKLIGPFLHSAGVPPEKPTFDRLCEQHGFTPVSLHGMNDGGKFWWVQCKE